MRHMYYGGCSIPVANELFRCSIDVINMDVGDISNKESICICVSKTLNQLSRLPLNSRSGLSGL